MATIVHRRPAPRSALPAAEPRGPGAVVDSVTWVGWVFGLAGFAVLVYTLRPALDQGDLRLWDWGATAQLVFVAVRNAAIVALPFALELGVPGARRLAPWLMRAAVLLALEQLAQPVIGAAEAFTFSTWFPDLGPGDPTHAPGFAFILVRLATLLLGIGGAWALADGLADAGARLARGVAIGVVAAGMALSLVAYLPLDLPALTGPSAPPVQVVGLNVVAMLLGFAEMAVWFLAGPRLAVGFSRRLHPRRAWAMAAVAGWAMLGVRFLGPVLIITSFGGVTVGLPFAIVAGGVWIALFLAFALGLGRGRERRRARPARTRLFVLKPTA